MVPTERTPPETLTARVLAAALELYDEVGYSAVTIDDIQRRSGVDLGAIHDQFGDEAEIAGAVYVKALGGFQLGLMQMLVDESVAEDGIRGGVGHYLRWVDTQRAEARFLMQRRDAKVVAASRADLDTLNHQTFGAMERWYRPFARAGQLRDLPLPLAYAVWFGPAHEYARVVLEGKGRGNLLDAETPLTDAAWAALRSSR
jgi:AcrR family transcriptional regulator